jgi:hypothetical protein
MKKLILVALLATSGLFGSHKRHIVHFYKNVPTWIQQEDVVIQSALIYAAWGAKYVVYNFEKFEFHDIVIFRAYNYDCSFFIRFNRKTHDCKIEFNARDNSFDYISFKKVMDTVFLFDPSNCQPIVDKLSTTEI